MRCSSLSMPRQTLALVDGRRTDVEPVSTRRSADVVSASSFSLPNSHSSETLARLEGILGGEALDLLFIDGDHTREGVEADFRMYSPLVRSGGLVAFHDIVPGPTEAVGAVPAFWRQFRSSERIEFVEDWSQGSCGIGVVRL
jgi:Methyltransferase domain